MNLRTVMTIMTFIIVFTAIPFAVSAEKGNGANGQGEEHRPENPSAVENKSSQIETMSCEQELDSKQSSGVDQAKNKTQETTASTKLKKPDHASQPPEHSNSERAKDHGQNSKADIKIDREKKNKQKPDHTGGKSPEHSKSERSKKLHPEKSETKQKEKDDQHQPSKPDTEKVLHNKKEEHSSSDSAQGVNLKTVKDESEPLQGRNEKEKPQSDQLDEDDSFEKFLNRLPEPDEEKDQSPVHDVGVLSYSTQTLQGKSGKDRPSADGKTQWVIGNVTDHSSVSDLNYNILVTRHDMMRNQWMNAPPGQPPKAASLFS